MVRSGQSSLVTYENSTLRRSARARAALLLGFVVWGPSLFIVCMGCQSLVLDNVSEGLFSCRGGIGARSRVKVLPACGCDLGPELILSEFGVALL
jgi:hypothetical protein